MIHTKGKWEVVHKMNVQSLDGRPICTCGTSDGTKRDNGMSENEANAQLIAAAPDLLEALEAYLNAPASMNMGYLSSEQIEAKKLMEKAIAKAKGISV